MTNQTPTRYLALPRSGKGPGVLVLHAWWGLTDVFRGVCDRLAREGFVALAPDLYSGRTAQTIEQAEQLLDQWDEEKEAPPILLSALDELSRSPALTGKGLGVIGFSMGAFWSLWLAEQKPEAIRAVTVFYGDGFTRFEHSQAAFMGHFAEKDPYEPPENVQALEQGLAAAHRPATLYTYAGTGHWFFEDNRPDAYNESAAQLAWERTVAFLHANLD